jgi:hypothetical protein
MATNPSTMKLLKAATAKAAARAAAAKQQVRSAKAKLKQARKLFKVEKKAAKQARRQMDAAAAAVAPRREPKPVVDAKVAVTKGVVAKARVRKPATVPKPARARRAPKPSARKSPETMRSAAEVAKSVIERLHSPPPVLLTPINSTDPAQPPTAAPSKT